MKRSTLLSVMIIGAVVSLLVGAGTFAAFVVEGENSADVTAGTLSVQVKGVGDAANFQFVPPDPSCPDEMAPGDQCTAHVAAKNTGTVHAEITNVTVTGVSDDEVNCPSANWVGTHNAVYGTDIAPGAEYPFEVFVDLDIGAPNGCMDVGATVTVVVELTSIPTP